MDDERADDFGCERCWPASAEAAWGARSGLDREAELVDESHFRVTILACPACAQRFVSVFTETIDWSDGEDPQHWVVLPVTAEEVAGLTRRADSFGDSELEALGPGRRSLRLDHPKGAERSVSWGTGILVGPHD